MSGDIADFIIADSIDRDDFFAAAEREEGGFLISTKECKYCGEKGLIWILCEPGDKWLLGDNKGQIHRCPKNPYVGNLKPKTRVKTYRLKNETTI